MSDTKAIFVEISYVLAKVVNDDDYDDDDKYGFIFMCMQVLIKIKK
jgi:hypothetical protein